jgi:hypothetical protein
LTGFESTTAKLRMPIRGSRCAAVAPVTSSTFASVTETFACPFASRS